MFEDAHVPYLVIDTLSYLYNQFIPEEHKLDSDQAKIEFDLGFFNGLPAFDEEKPIPSKIRLIGSIMGSAWRLTRDTGIVEKIKETFEKLHIAEPPDPGLYNDYMCDTF